MKEYKVVNLNKAIHMSRDKDLAQMEENINALVAEGWELQQVISPNDLGGVVIGISDQFRIPVRYIGIGEGIDQLKMFDRKEFVNALFGSEAK